MTHSGSKAQIIGGLVVIDFATTLLELSGIIGSDGKMKGEISLRWILRKDPPVDAEARSLHCHTIDETRSWDQN
jgi:hypothetical protein